MRKENNKKLYLISISSLVLASVIACLSLFVYLNQNNRQKEITSYKIYSIYTQEELIARLIDSRYEKEEQSIYGKIKNITTQRLYSFYDQEPNYFLLEIEYYRPIELELTFSENGRYYQVKTQTYFTNVICGFSGDITPIVNRATRKGFGRSPFSVLGLQDCKKFYGKNTLGVEIDGKVYELLKYKTYTDYVDLCLGEEYWQRDYRALLEEREPLTEQELIALSV